MISVVLTKYKRSHLFNHQYTSIKNQTLQVDEILVCDNTEDNKGVWERFKLAQECKNELICIFDDDTIPGHKFLENCYNEMQKKEGLYGTRGLIFNNSTCYGTELVEQGIFASNYKEVGWCEPNNEVKRVDYVTHSWFFKKKWLSYFWDVDEVPLNYGEDMNFSYQLQKEGIKTYVPPHPNDNKDMWGSLYGEEYGDDGNGLWTSNEGTFRQDMYNYFDKLVDNKWNLINSTNLL